MLRQLRASGTVEIQERAPDTVHLLWNGIKVSAFVLEHLVPHVAARHLDVTGILATKLHVILDRGLRRDFFDLYVMLETGRLGIVAALAAIRTVYRTPIDDALLLRALTYFDDADREARLPGEGPRDWTLVKEYFLLQVGHLLVPPLERLAIQACVVDVRAAGPRGGKGSTRRSASPARPAARQRRNTATSTESSGTIRNQSRSTIDSG
jgi:hypothetical protein